MTLEEHFLMQGKLKEFNDHKERQESVPIIDVHSHPSLKIYLINKKIWERHYVLPDVVPSGMHVDLPGMNDSNVRVAFCYHYVPEVGFRRLSQSRCLFEVLRRYLAADVIEKFENNSYDAYEKVLSSIQSLNEQIDKARGKGFDVIIPTNLQGFEDGWNLRKTLIVHCLEGGHHLGRNLSVEVYKQRLQALKERGVAIITIAHFFPNAICDTGGGIPPSTARAIGYSKDIANNIGFPDPVQEGLSDIGRDIVHWCQDNRMIIDLVHCSREARSDIYSLLRQRRQQGATVIPVIFSHSGLRENVVRRMNLDDKYILPDLDELETLFEFGGLFSLILMNYWTRGIEEDTLSTYNPGIKYIIQTLRRIKDRFCNLNNIAIGTDLDGFTQVPDDIKHVRLMYKLRNRLVKEFGEEDAEKICNANALGVIRNGWS